MPRTVYEAANKTLKEYFIGATASRVDTLMASHQTRPPRAVAHWRFSEQAIAYRELERDVSDADVPAFIREYARSIEPEGWRVIVE